MHKALVAKHKAESLLRRRQAGLDQRLAELRKHLPRSTADLKVLSTEASGKLKYGYEDTVVEVTPRKLRDRGEAQDQAAAARFREATPDRALKKVCGKIKRRHQKMWRGEEEPVVAKAAGRMGTCAGEEPSPALALLDDPVSLQRLREYFEFLQSHRLHYCATCDEQWGVFDREWPQAGVATAGEKAGTSECIKASDFLVHSETSCKRCSGSQKTAYGMKFCKDNLQHLGEPHPAISRLTWYESLLVARVHPVISVVTLLATGSLCFAGHVCIYYVKVFATTCYTLHATRYMLHASCYMLHATSYMLHVPGVRSAAEEQEVVPQQEAQEPSRASREDATQEAHDR